MQPCAPSSHTSAAFHRTLTPTLSFILQIPTLGDARGKILALNRVGNAKLPASLTPVGLDLGPSVFADNDPDFQIKYKAPDTSSVVRVEDYVRPHSSRFATLARA